MFISPIGPTNNSRIAFAIDEKIASGRETTPDWTWRQITSNLNSPDLHLRCKAIETIAVRHLSMAIPNLIAILQDNGDSIIYRIAAAKALGDMKAQEAVPVLGSLLEKNDWSENRRYNYTLDGEIDFRSAVITALENIPTKEATAVLFKFATNKKPSFSYERTRFKVTEALIRKVINALSLGADVYKDLGKDVTEFALIKLSNPNHINLLAHLKKDQYSVETLGEIAKKTENKLAQDAAIDLLVKLNKV